MKPALDIRQANADDVPTIIEVAQKTFVETYGETNKKENVEQYMSNMFSTDKICAEINSEIDFAVLGLTSSANIGQPSTAREDLSAREQRMQKELRRRRPRATALMEAGRSPVHDTAAEGPVNPVHGDS